MWSTYFLTALEKIMPKVVEAGIESDKSWEVASLHAIQKASETVLGYKSICFSVIPSRSFENSDLTFKEEAIHERFTQRIYRDK